ncbi:catalase [Chitinophaga costaii]|uniref:Catalase n=1 Tax=Chitinophaga costaii TaxID=1335309 RepID=A0A1C4EH19_9BACT|nr:catalase HPII [Chitinophaga costaii]PUZ23831.1 catalase HPII [Chitinophaga costaii]SCC42840.1 catalase [Chitinophaga costaii]
MAKKQSADGTPHPVTNPNNTENAKTKDLQSNTSDATDQPMTTNHGVKISDDQNSLKAGDRGPSLLEDFILREKITHFDHERIPERVVHARGSAAHGVFKVYQSQAALTKAGFLTNPDIETPVFVRFSTVAGSRGSSDLARDARGFAVKFYTQEGNFDLVGNNIPVFFIQDAIKFPDLIHAVKPEPDNEMPQAASAHDTFWDFISLLPESAHMITWVMSDRAIPRSYRMMEGFGVHTFRLVNAEGVSHFVKFHWKPLLGVHSIAWDEAQIISGKDPDFHRRDLWNAIESGSYPEWELGIQVVPEADEHKFDFDLLDPTKLIPEELVPVQRIGKMTLNRNPDNFFAETEQVAFHIGHIVPGIDFTNDPLLQGRLFSYTDTQLLRLGGPNFHEIPINRPIAPAHNNQRDGHMRQEINRGKASYHPNSLGGGCPFQSGKMQGGFTSYPERIDAHKVRERSPSFLDHFSQATLFYNSQSEPEKNHIIDAFSFELGKVQSVPIRERMLRILAKVDSGLATHVAYALRLHIPKQSNEPLNQAVPADAAPGSYEPVVKAPSQATSAALSMAHTVKDNIRTRQVAILAADGVDATSLLTIKDALTAQGAVVEVIAPRQGYIIATDDQQIPVDKSLLTTASVFYDAVYVPAGTNSVATLEAEADAIHFLNEAFKHCKAIAADKGALQVIEATYFSRKLPPDNSDETVKSQGIVISDNLKKLATQFIAAIAQHRFWEREKPRKIPA